MPTVTINDLTAISTGDITDDVMLAVYDPNAPSDNTKKASRAQLLSSVGPVVVADLTVTKMSAMTFAGGSGISDMVAADLAVTHSDIVAGASEDVAVTLADAAATDLLLSSFVGALPAGLLCQAWISAANTVTFRLFNATSGTITGAIYTSPLRLRSHSHKERHLASPETIAPGGTGNSGALASRTAFQVKSGSLEVTTDVAAGYIEFSGGDIIEIGSGLTVHWRNSRADPVTLVYFAIA